MRKFVLYVSAIAGVAGLTGLILSQRHPNRIPPAVGLADTLDTEIPDDSGTGVWEVNLYFSNSNKPGFFSDAAVYIRSSSNAVKLRHEGNSIELGPASMLIGRVGLGPSESRRRSLLVPAGTDSCTISLAYTGSVVKQGRLAWLAQRLPLSLRSRIGPSLWRWLGFTRYGPDSVWREVSVTVPITPPPAP